MTLRNHLDSIAHYTALLLVLAQFLPLLVNPNIAAAKNSNTLVSICTAFGISYITSDEIENTDRPLYKPDRPHCSLCIIENNLSSIIIPDNNLLLNEIILQKQLFWLPSGRSNFISENHILAHPRAPPIFS